MINSVYLGENNPEAYQIQNNSLAIESGFLINGSTDITKYLQHNGGLDYFGNSVSHHFPSNIGAFNGARSMDILEINTDDIKLYPSVTDDYVNISIHEHSGPIKTEIYEMSGAFMGFQNGNKLSFKKFNSGTYYCVVIYGDKKNTFRVVKL